MTEQELRKEIAADEVGGLYLLAGEEKMLVKRAARRLIQRAGGENFPEFNLNELPGEAEADRIIDAAVALPFMAPRKCVAVSDYNADEKPQQELDKLYALMDDLPESTVLVFWYPTLDFEGKKSAKWKKFLEKAGKAGKTVTFPRREAGELRRLLTKEAEKQGCQLLPKAAARLMEYAGTDLTLLLGELEKLTAFTLSQGGTEITAEAVELLTPKSTETTVFLMVNALVAGEYEKAYGLLEDLFRQNEEPIAILGAMAASYVDMYRVKSALESGLTSAAPAGYASDYKNRQFRLRNAERSARGFTARSLKTCLDLLLEADLALKGSRLEARLVLDSLVARLLLATREGRA